MLRVDVVCGQEEELPLTAVREEVVNMLGLRPSAKAVWNAIQMVAMTGTHTIPYPEILNFQFLVWGPFTTQN